MSKVGKFCQLCTVDEMIYHTTIFMIDGLILCDKHTSEYIHAETYPSSSGHRKQFDKLLGRMQFVEE